MFNDVCEGPQECLMMVSFWKKDISVQVVQDVEKNLQDDLAITRQQLRDAVTALFPMDVNAPASVIVVRTQTQIFTAADGVHHHRAATKCLRARATLPHRGYHRSRDTLVNTAECTLTTAL